MQAGRHRKAGPQALKHALVNGRRRSEENMANKMHLFYFQQTFEEQFKVRLVLLGRLYYKTLCILLANVWDIYAYTGRGTWSEYAFTGRGTWSICWVLKGRFCSWYTRFLYFTCTKISKRYRSRLTLWEWYLQHIYDRRVIFDCIALGTHEIFLLWVDVCHIWSK